MLGVVIVLQAVETDNIIVLQAAETDNNNCDDQ